MFPHARNSWRKRVQFPNRRILYSENIPKFRYLRTTVTNQKLIQEEIKCRLSTGNFLSSWATVGFSRRTRLHEINVVSHHPIALDIKTYFSFQLRPICNTLQVLIILKVNTAHPESKRHTTEIQYMWRRKRNYAGFIFRMIKCRIMKWAGHVVSMGEKFMQRFGRKTWRKEITRKKQEWMGK
jgi:hypothetical protein